MRTNPVATAPGSDSNPLLRPWTSWSLRPFVRKRIHPFANRSQLPVFHFSPQPFLHYLFQIAFSEPHTKTAKRENDCRAKNVDCGVIHYGPHLRQVFYTNANCPGSADVVVVRMGLTLLPRLIGCEHCRAESQT